MVSVLWTVRTMVTVAWNWETLRTEDVRNCSLSSQCSISLCPVHRLYCIYYRKLLEGYWTSDDDDAESRSIKPLKAPRAQKVRETLSNRLRALRNKYRIPVSQRKCPVAPLMESNQWSVQRHDYPRQHSWVPHSVYPIPIVALLFLGVQR